MVDGPQQVAADTKEILNESVRREKTLRVRGGFEPSHLSLALPRRLMRNLRSIASCRLNLTMPSRQHDSVVNRAALRPDR